MAMAVNMKKAGVLRRQHVERDAGGEEGADHELAFGADVPQTHAEGDGDAERGQDEGRRLDGGVGPAVERTEGEVAHAPVDEPGVGADDAQEQRADKQGEDDQDEGREDAEPAWLDRDAFDVQVACGPVCRLRSESSCGR